MELGLFPAGGKGNASRRTPDDIVSWCEKTGLCPDSLVTASRTSAKVDSAAVQDGYQIYHHAFFFDRAGAWAVVQQGMNDTSGMARRYHGRPRPSATSSASRTQPSAAICAPRRSTWWRATARPHG